MKNYQEYLEMLEQLTKLKGLEAEVYNAIGFLDNPVKAPQPKTVSVICDEIQRQRKYHEVYTDGGSPESLWFALLPKEFRRWWFERKVAAIVQRLTDPETDRLRRLDDGRLVRSYADWPQRKQAS